MLINKAIEIATRAHSGQYDTGGNPYIFHPLRVMLNVKGGENEQCAAVLHDVMEDTDVTEADLIRNGFDKDIITALNLLTKASDMDYMDYIRNLKVNPIARAVKAADLEDNMDMSRIENPTEKDYIRLKKYIKAKKLLEE